jgi:polar amino acid transport system permease protein
MPFAPLRAAASSGSETFRRIPFLVLLLLVFFLSQALKIEAPLWAIAVTAVAIRMSALAAENVRAGYESCAPRSGKPR